MKSKNYSKKYLKSINKYSKYRNLIFFLFIGAFSTIFDISILLILKQFFPYDVVYFNKIPISIDNCISFTISSVINFLLNRSINFKNTHEQVFYQYLHFLAIGIVGLILNSIAFGYLSQYMTTVPAKIIAALIVICWSFPANRFITFGKKFS